MDINEFLSKSHHFCNLSNLLETYFDFEAIEHLDPGDFYSVDLHKGKALIDHAITLLGFYIVGQVSYATDEIKKLNKYHQQATFKIWLDVINDKDALRGIGNTIFETYN